MSGKEQRIQSVWTREEPRSRRRDQPALSRDQIVAAALELLDSDGIEALSMRKLGARLNAGATSLYTHVANKDEIMELVTDAVFGEIEPPTVGPWRDALTTLAKDLHAMILRHPWLATALGYAGLLYLAPSLLRLNNGTLVMLEEAGFDDDDADTTLNVLWAFVLGLAIANASARETIRRSGLTEEEWYRKLIPTAEVAARPYPVLHKRYVKFAAEAKQPMDVDDIRMTSLEVQISRVLDGLDPALRQGKEPTPPKGCGL